MIIGKHLEQKWLEDHFKSAAVKASDLVEIKNKNLEDKLKSKFVSKEESMGAKYIWIIVILKKHSKELGIF